MNKAKSTPEIIQELQEGLEIELNTRLLFEKYYLSSFNFFRRKGMSPEDCQDLTQKVFIAVYKGVVDFRQDSKFETWLFRIATNIYISELEQRQAQKRREQDSVSISLSEQDKTDENHSFIQIADKMANPVESLLDKEKAELLHQAMLQLPDQMRCCAQLRWAKEHSYQEIANVMKISINTVKAHIHQARKILREKLSFYFNEVEG